MSAKPHQKQQVVAHDQQSTKTSIHKHLADKPQTRSARF